MKKGKEKLTVYSLFTGAGGFDIGFEEAGFEIIGATDIWIESQKTMALNYPNVPFILKDIKDSDTSKKKQVFQKYIERILYIFYNPNYTIGHGLQQQQAATGMCYNADVRFLLYWATIALHIVAQGRISL